MSRPFTVDDLLNVNKFTHRCPWDISPDGGLLAVTLSQGKRRVPRDPRKGQENGAHIVLIDVESGEPMEPFSDLQMSWSGRWSPDGQTLAAYVVAEDAHACIGLWNKHTHEVTIVSNARIPWISNFEVPQWTPDCRRIVVPLIPNSRDTTVSTDIIVRSYIPGRSASDQNRPFYERRIVEKCVGVLDVESGVVTELAPGLKPRPLRAAPDGRAVAFLSNISNPVGRPHVIADVNVVPFDGLDPYTVARNVPVNTYACRFSWSPDCKTISYVTGGDYGEPLYLYLAPADGSTEPALVTEFTSYLGNRQIPWWTADSRRVIWLQKGSLYNLSIEDGSNGQHSQDLTGNHFRINAIAQRYGESILHTDDRGDILAHSTDTRDGLDYIVRIHSVSGETSKVCPAQLSSPDEFTLIASGRFVFARGKIEFDEMVHAYSLESGEAKTLFNTNPWRRGVAKPVRKTIEFKDANGRVQEAALFLPEDYLVGYRLPMVVTIYPGGQFSKSDRYFSEAQLLTSAGYAALYPDSIMEDDNPIDQIVGVTLPAVNRAIEMGFAEKSRIGVWGHSYGGYGVMALVTQTQAFRAAVANAPAGINMASTYLVDVNGMAWCEGRQARNGGSLWEKRDAYIENSPLFAFEQVEAPVLVIWGTRDVLTSAGARETFLGLRQLGKRVEMREYRRESHLVTNWSAKNTRDYYESVLSWFNLYLNEEQ
ncbi:MAG: prolyl oligopeptidase family serine peptidase [Gemmatimonadota bacterium]|nr:prolyl oligopeptidase family serine peptidase [Gemmatimonadota bacterium]